MRPSSRITIGLLLITLGTASRATAQGSPSVTFTRPPNGRTGVDRDAFVSADVHVPNGGIDPATLTATTVLLRNTATSQPVAAVRNTSGGGDVIVLRPTSLLVANTSYTFVVTAGLKDVAGVAFLPYSMTFTTGTGLGTTNPAIAFEQAPLTAPPGSYTCLTLGPDGKLYGSLRTGEIVRFPILLDGTLGTSETITSLRDAEGGDRLLIGLRFDPAATASDLILWVSHSYYAFGEAPDWTGKITRLRGPQLQEVTDYVIHLPRSVVDHVTNQMDFGPDGALYIAQGSSTAMGAPDSAWSFRPERLLSASILRLDVAATVPPLDAQTEDGGTFDPLDPTSPLTIYASGVRNAYDLVWHDNGHLYAPGNGSASGGAAPASPNPVHCTNRIDHAANGDYNGPVVPGISSVAETQRDYLYDIEANGYYGHPNPTRCEWVLNGGNPTSGSDPDEVLDYPAGTLPDRNRRPPVFDFGFHESPDGIVQSRSAAFDGALTGKLLVARFSGGDDILLLTPASDGRIVAVESGMPGMTALNNPIDLVENPDTGILYVSEYGDPYNAAGAKLTALRPVPSDCVGDLPGNAVISVSKDASTRARVHWAPIAGASGYDMVFGSLAALLSSNGDFTTATSGCLANEFVTTSCADTLSTAAAVWYLVRAVRCSNEGSYDTGSPRQIAPRDGRIDSAAGRCP